MGQEGKEIYIDIAPLHEKNNAVLVQDAITGMLYVRKTLRLYDLRVYKALQQAPHPNLVAVHQLQEQPEGTLQVHEQYINGITLEKYLEDKKCLDEEEALDIAMQLTAALQHLHTLTEPVIHRDVKLSNVMRETHGRIYLCDYNAARMHTAFADRDTVPLGTQGYAAPEQFGFQQSDARTDIYAFGVLFNLLLTGKHPTQQLAEGRFRQVVEKCIAFAPEKRFKDVTQLRAALQPKPGKSTRGHNAGHKRKGLLISACVAVVLALGVGLAVLWPRFTPITPSSSATTGVSTGSVGQSTSSSAGGRLSLGDSMVFDKLEFTFGTQIHWATVENAFSEYDGQDVFYVEVTLRNLSSVPHALNRFYCTQFGPGGTKLARVSSNFTNTIDSTGDIPPGGEYTGYLYFLYEGEGEYVAQYSKHGEDTVTVRIPVST